VRRSCFAACNGCDEGFFLYHEDFDLCLRARAAGWRVRLVPEARAVHIKGASAFLDPALFWRHYHASRLRLLRKHHPPGWGRVLAALYTAGVVVRSAVTAAAGLVTGRAELRARARCHAEALRAIRNAEV
jgi:GT2 family glycosyltransferase